jgi:hypothetical protein
MMRNLYKPAGETDRQVQNAGGQEQLGRGDARCCWLMVKATSWACEDKDEDGWHGGPRIGCNVSRAVPVLVCYPCPLLHCCCDHTAKNMPCNGLQY